MSTQQHKPNVAQLASTYHLGTPVGVYPKSRTPEVIRTLSAYGVLLLSLLLFFLAIATSNGKSPFVDSTTFSAWSFFASIVLFLPSFGYSLVGSSYLFSGCIYAFTDGFIYVRRSKSIVFRWEEIKLILNNQIQGPYSFSSYMSVIHVNGNVISLHIRGIKPFISLLRQRVAAARMRKI
jgi:hypothetical protein